MTRRTLTLVTATVTAAALGAGAVGRGDWLHQVLSLSALLWIGLPGLGGMVLAAVKRRARLAFTAGLIPWFLGTQLAVGMAFLHWDIAAGKRDSETIVPVLDDIYADTGQFPRSLAADARLALGHPLRPNLVNYYSDGSTFTLEVSNPAELFGGFTFSNDDRQWKEWRD